jgi:hypothetical protein
MENSNEIGGCPMEEKCEYVMAILRIDGEGWQCIRPQCKHIFEMKNKE